MMVPQGRIERPSDDYKSTVLPLYYKGMNGCRGWLRSTDLQVMSLTSYLAALRGDIWSCMTDSNRRLLLGRQRYCHCTNTAFIITIPLSSFLQPVAFYLDLHHEFRFSLFACAFPTLIPYSTQVLRYSVCTQYYFDARVSRNPILSDQVCTPFCR